MLSPLSHSAVKAAVVAFAGVVLLDPGDKLLHLKMPLLILVLVLWGARCVSGKVHPGSLRLCAGVLFFAFILPAISSWIAIVNDALPIGEPPAFQLIREFSVILLIPVIVSERIDLMTTIRRWAIAVASFTIIVAVLRFIAPVAFEGIKAIAIAGNDMIIRQRSELGLGLGSFYYKTASVLVFPFAFHLRGLLNAPHKIRGGFMVLLFGAAALCSDSRAIAIAIFMICVCFVVQKLKSSFGVSLAFLGLLLMLLLPAGYFATFFHSTELSNAAKLGHLHSYAELFNDHPTYLLWGQGADAEFYTQGFEAKTTLTELTYLDLIRWFGIPGAGLILCGVLYPIVVLVRRGDALSYLAVPYVAYLWEATSNPLLVCSFGALVVSAMWQTAVRRKSEYANAVQEEYCLG